jgi:cell division protein ZapE
MEMISSAYDLAVREGRLNADPRQEAVAARLDVLALQMQARPKGLRAAAARAGRALGLSSPAPGGNGFYLYGGVGRGKTMLMDMFFGLAPVRPNRRVHFHAFMLEVHDFLHRLRQKKAGDISTDDALMACADHVAATARLLCFDEFQVRDVADAMILGRLFTALFDRGVTVVMTSNIPPDELYKDGLNRDRFLPFIALLKQRLDVMHFDGAVDYRLRKIEGRPVYFWPHDADAVRALDAIFTTMADGAAVERREIEIKGRKLVIPRAARDVACFHFSEICEIAAGAGDYLALADQYRFVIVKDVPKLDDGRRDVALRFVTLIDALYDRGRHIALSAAADVTHIYKGAALQVVFDRTVSRLIEMQSQAYREASDDRLA